MILGLESHPRRGTVTRDRPPLRQLLYGSKPDTYRILYAVDERRKLVNVAHIRHGARRPLSPSKRT